MTDTTQPHPEPSEEASSLPVVAWSGIDGRWLRRERSAVSNRALTYHADAQSQLNAMRAERDAARVLAASHSNECEKWAAMHQRSKAEISDLKTDYECRLKKLCDHGMGLCDQIDALKAALKAAPVVDVEAIMRLAEKMMRDSWATGDDSAWHPARDELRAALASPEGSQHD